MLSLQYPSAAPRSALKLQTEYPRKYPPTLTPALSVSPFPSDLPFSWYVPITIVTGIILWLVERAIYSALLNSIPRAVLLGIMFGVLALGLSLIVFGYSTAAGIFNENVITGSSGSGSVIVMLLLGIIVMFGAGTLFQWLYSLNPNDENIAPTSYVFVIDDSGSRWMPDFS